jgi:p-hydroxybenzoate 3-monooxygenase
MFRPATLEMVKPARSLHASRARTKVGIIGAGPAGMLLAHRLRQEGVDCVVLERRDRAYVEGRVRAGVLEQTTVDLMARLGLDARLRAEGLAHSGATLAWEGELLHIDFAELTGGSTVVVYGQQEVMKDLFDAAGPRGLQIVFDAAEVALHDLATTRPFVTWRKDGAEQRLDCEIVVGCDGFHGVSRASIPSEALSIFERTYPFGWLGVLADVPPCGPELVYASHARGFALASMRSATRSRYYIQCGVDERLEDWSDARFWDELVARLGAETGQRVERGNVFEKSFAPLRSFVAEPMRHGRLFLAGDAAHIVPPTGAKGLNLAAADVAVLAQTLSDFHRTGSDAALEAYSDRVLARVWKAERFSWWFTTLTHRFPGATGFDRRMQEAELAYIRDSRAAQTVLAENYVGLPLELT